jgi:hypothetical protein
MTTNNRKAHDVLAEIDAAFDLHPTDATWRDLLTLLRAEIIEADSDGRLDEYIKQTLAAFKAAIKAARDKKTC